MADGQQQFIVVSVTRASIAEMFNECIQDNLMDIPLFTDDSDLLTNGICQEVAIGLGEVLDDDLSEEDRGHEEREFVETIVRKHFG